MNGDNLTNSWTENFKQALHDQNEMFHNGIAGYITLQHNKNYYQLYSQKNYVYYYI